MVALALGMTAALGGCYAQYATPGGPARISEWADPAIADALAVRPAIRFPATLAVVRVQDSGYRYRGYSSYGKGNYSVALGTDIETDEHLARLHALPQVRGVASMSTLLLPENLRDESELRKAAARLHADALVIYTLDTDFYREETVAPLTAFTLGAMPNQMMHVQTVASAIIVDTQTGYVYGTAEGRSNHEQRASLWTSAEAADQSRFKTEVAAFNELMDEFEGTWSRVVAEQGGNAEVTSAAAPGAL